MGHAVHCTTVEGITYVHIYVSGLQLDHAAVALSSLSDFSLAGEGLGEKYLDHASESLELKILTLLLAIDSR